MKKIIVFILVMILMLVTLCGCNKQMADFTYKFDRACVYLPSGEVVEGKVDSWLDFEDGDQIQVKIDGVMYLTHSSNVVLIND